MILTVPLKPLLLAGALVLSGCAIVEPVARPDIDIPPEWHSQGRSETADELTRTWWQGFGSAQLDRLVNTALSASPDLRIQYERVVQAELALRSAGASLLPALDLGGSTGWSRDNGGGASRDSRSSSLRVIASYELDLWGRSAANVASADAALSASRYDLDALRLSMTATVATAYVQLLALHARLDIAHANLDTARRVYRVVDARYRNGAATALDLSRQRTTVLTQEAGIAPLETQLEQTRSALAILLGSPPQNFTLDSEALTRLSIPEVTAGLPSGLLSRRPDLAAADAALQGAAADIAAARAAMLPTFSLSAAGGLASDMLLSLASPTSSLSLSAAVAHSLFDGGQLRNQVDSARSRQRALLEQYRKTVLTALKEVEDALANTARDLRQEGLQEQMASEARRTLRLAELRYREGADDVLGVLDAQRTLFSTQDNLVQLRQARLMNAVELYRALGGGWQPPSSVTH